MHIAIIRLRHYLAYKRRKRELSGIGLLARLPNTLLFAPARHRMVWVERTYLPFQRLRTAFRHWLQFHHLNYVWHVPPCLPYSHSPPLPPPAPSHQFLALPRLRFIACHDLLRRPCFAVPENCRPYAVATVARLRPQRASVCAANWCSPSLGFSLDGSSERLLKRTPNPRLVQHPTPLQTPPA